MEQNENKELEQEKKEVTENEVKGQEEQKAPEEPEKVEDGGEPVEKPQENEQDREEPSEEKPDEQEGSEEDKVEDEKQEGDEDKQTPPSDEPTDSVEEEKEEKKEEVDPQEDERFKQIQAELEDMKAEKEEQKQVMDFANKAKEVDARFNNFCVGLSNALENEFKKFGIDLTKSIEEIAKENPAQAEMARNLMATAERIRTQEAMKAQEEIKNTYLNVVFHKAERLLKKYDVTETEAPLVADTFVQILRATGVNNLKEDLEQKVQLAVANAKYLISKNAPVVEEKPAVEEPKDVPPVEQTEEPPVEPTEVEVKEPTKEEPEVDINEFKEGVQGDAGKATVSVDNILEHMASLPFKERVQYYKDNFNLVTEAAKKRYNK